MTPLTLEHAPAQAGATDEVVPAQTAATPESVPPLAGDWTIYRAAELHVSLKAMVAEGTERFDLSGVGEFDSSGVQLLLAPRRRLADGGRRAAFVEAPDTVRDVLRAYALESILDAPAQEPGE